MIKLFDKKDNCCGCTACASSCKNDAIVMKSDEEGFKYPLVNNSLCVECSKCLQVCDYQKMENSRDTMNHLAVLAVRNANREILNESSSGGAFSAIAQMTYEKCGIVYGAILDDDFKVTHLRSTNPDDLVKMRGSKYVQSEVEGLFRRLKIDLQDSPYVLFVGTPCQVAGLKSYLGRDYENLLLVDFVCHGTPSPLIWKEHVSYIMAKRKMRLKDYRFRSKILGWHRHTEMCIFENNAIDYYSFDSQVFKRLFYKNVLLRPSCYNCPYASLNRVSDITLGDFWSNSNNIKKIDNNSGISMLIINTNKGGSIFDQFKSKLRYGYYNIGDCAQPQLYTPSIRPCEREKFWNSYYKYGYESAYREILRISAVEYFKSKIKKFALFKQYAKHRY